jgi:phage gp16-like protein
MSKSGRARYLAHIHAAAKAQGWNEGTYRDWIKRRTGKTSCAELDDAQLGALAATLKPTGPQWEAIHAACREMGWSGTADCDFKAFVKRTTKADEPLFLTRRQLTDVLVGLAAWQKSLRQRGKLPAPAARG